MKYWIYRDGLQRGPFTLEELADMNLTPDTPVWYEGLDNWITAAESPGLAPFLSPRHEFGNNEPEEVDYIEAGEDSRSDFGGQTASSQQQYSSPQQQSHQQSSYGQMPQGECPPTYLTLSIISTICCCLPLGIAAIIFSSKVKPSWQQGNERGARKASETAELLIILSITLSFLSMPLAFLF